MKRPEDLRGRTLATGARDSPQSHLLPLHFLQQNGLMAGRDFSVRRFDLYGRQTRRPRGRRARGPAERAAGRERRLRDP